MNLSTKNPAVLAIIAIGAFWFLTQNKARAAGITATSKAPPVASSFLRTINQNLPTRRTADGQAPLSAYISAGLGILKAAPGIARDFTGQYAARQQAGVFSPDYLPSYTPDTAGEAAAATYYQEHADAFIAPMPDYEVINATEWAQAAINDPGDY